MDSRTLRDRATAPEAVRPSEASHVARRILHLQILTIVWMIVEAGVSLGTAWRSHSPALFAFGGDSLIELLSAALVLCRFRFELNEARAARIAGVLLFVLAGLVALTSILSFLGYREAQRSMVGIGILLAAALVMPWLARRKRQIPDGGESVLGRAALVGAIEEFPIAKLAASAEADAAGGDTAEGHGQHGKLAA